MTTAESRLDERVILLDARGRPAGTALKRSVHGRTTPLHLAFSCHVFDTDGRVLLTQRAGSKPTWPNVWTNACCGHPAVGETLRMAVTRRLREELGVQPARLSLAVSDFTYRAAMDNGVVEHELCPVLVAEIDAEPMPNPDEVGDVAWMRWSDLCARARDRPDSLSPWSVAQIASLRSLGRSPKLYFDLGNEVLLDSPIAGAGPVSAARTRSFDPLAPIDGSVTDLLGQFVTARRTELVDIDPHLGAVVDEIGALISAGGKRLRPAFVHWGHRAGGGEPSPGVTDLAAAVEMLHTFALLHDDVMDRSATRRSRPAAHRALATMHAAEGLEGDGDWFGVSAAVLAGDLAFAWADELLHGARLDPWAVTRARRVFNSLRAEVMAGQYLDLRLACQSAVDPEAARQVALLKSGRYTVTRPLALGLAASGREDEVVRRALADYGDAIGLAFQMRDDVLGLFGDPAVTGKPCGDDLREGKRTLLVLRALTLATTPERTFLHRALGDPRLSDDDVERCCDIVASSGALASIETLVRAERAIAIAALAVVDGEPREALATLADLAVHRDR